MYSLWRILLQIHLIFTTIKCTEYFSTQISAVTEIPSYIVVQLSNIKFSTTAPLLRRTTLFFFFILSFCPKWEFWVGQPTPMALQKGRRKAHWQRRPLGYHQSVCPPTQLSPDPPCGPPQCQHGARDKQLGENLRPPPLHRTVRKSVHVYVWKCCVYVSYALKFEGAVRSPPPPFLPPKALV